MFEESWRQWRDLLNTFAASSRPGNAAPGTPGSSDYLRTLQPYMEMAEKFRTEAQGFLERAGKAGAAGAQGLPQAAQKFSEFLREQFAQFQPPWAATPGAAAPGPRAGAEASGSAGASAPPPWDMAMQWLQQLPWPTLGVAREQQDRWQRLLAIGRRIENAQQRLQQLWSDTLRNAANTYAERVQRQGAKPADPNALRELYDAWIDCAEAAYEKVAHSEAYSQAQAEYINAGGQWHQEMQQAVQAWAQSVELPTRAEFAALTQRVARLEGVRDREPAARAASRPASKPRQGSKPAARSPRPRASSRKRK